MKRPHFRIVPLVALLLVTPAVWAQTAEVAAVKQSVTITPRVSVTETLTNNVSVSSANPKSDQVTEISPGIRINVEGSRLKTYFDYSLSEITYAQGSSANRHQNSLNTFGTLEAIDNWAFIDFTGNISQQSISAFGAQSVNSTAVNSNRTEVANYQVSPYLKGRLGGAANYLARVSRAVTSSDNAAAFNSASTNSTLNVSSASAFRSLGWTADASRQTVAYSAGRTTEDDNYSLGLTYELTPQIKLSGNSGRESSNFTSLQKQNYHTSSLGLTWTPSESTSLSALAGKRAFGNNHSVSFEHRSARTVWHFSDSKDVFVGPNQNGYGSIGNVFDLFYGQLANSGLSTAERARLVSLFLDQYNVNPNSPVLGSFLTSAVSLQRRQDLSFALLGIRDTVTFLVSRTQSNRLDTFTSSVDSLSNANAVTQNGFSVNYSHRLTPDYSLGVLLSQQNTSSSTANSENKLKSLNISVSGKVSQKSAASVGLRHVVSDSLTTPSYTETAVTGNLNVQF